MAENRKAVFVFIILLFSCLFLHAEGEVSYFIANADDETIRNMAEVRGLDTSQSTASLRNTLLEGEEAFESGTVEETEGYSLEIVNAGNMDVSRDGLITLSGNVEVIFTLEDESSDKTLYADHMLLDGDNGRLTAYGNVRYEDSEEDSSLENISADIVTYLYDSGDLLVSGGMTSSQRTNNEDEPVTFYTTGSLLNYRSSDGGMFFRDGYLTSNPDTAYSSITAENIALLEGGDMFLTNAYLSIGRVPIIYLPAFFFPGSRLSMNPAFGFNSERGMFVSTTTEIFGRYPNFADAEESSFASLLRSEGDENMVSNGLYYEAGTAEGGVARWAQESESYLALLADVYQRTGFLLGFDTQLNFFDDALSAASETSFILSPEVPYLDGNYRFYSINSVDVSSSFADLRLSLPMYSDPYVLRQYSNRLTSFSIDSILGGTQEFPATRTSTVSNYEARLSGSIRLPSSLTNDYIKTLRISNISADADFSWSGTEHRYEVSDITLPAFTLTMSGDLFNLSSSEKSDEGEESEEFDLTEQFIIENPLLYDLYILEKEEERSVFGSGSYLRLSYNLSERFSNQFEYDMDRKKAEDNETDSTSSLSLTLEGGFSQILTFSQRFTPSYSYEFDESDDEMNEHDFSLLSASTVSLPVIGLTYDFSAYLYRFNLQEDLHSREEEEILYAFDKDNVRVHRLRFSKSFGSRDNYGVITPSLSYTLPPLSAVLTPSLSYRLGGLSAAFSWRFEEESEDAGGLRSDDIDFSLSLNYTHFTFSYSMNYESALFDRDDLLLPLSINTSASLRSEDRLWSITETLDFDFENNGDRNVVNSLRTSLSIPYFDIVYNMATKEGRLQSDYLEIRSDVDNIELYAWKNRIYLSAILDARLRYDFMNAYSSSLSIKAGLEFSIAEFLSLELSFTTTNNGFYRYMENGKFSFDLMLDDLWRSFDFFGDGRMNTQFNLQSFDMELVHYMHDWDLHLRYTAQLEDTGNNTYGWVPTFAIYLRWATMPDLKVDETYHETAGGWQRTGSLYASED